VTIGALGGQVTLEVGSNMLPLVKRFAQHGRLAKMSFPQQLVGMSTTTIAIAVSLPTTNYLHIYTYVFLLPLTIK